MFKFTTRHHYIVGRTPEQRAAVERILAVAAAAASSSPGGVPNAAAVLGLSAAEARSSIQWFHAYLFRFQPRYPTS